MIYKLIIDGLSDDFKATYKTELRNLLEKAPSDSAISSQITKIKKGYLGALNVLSSQGRFMATANAANPQELAKTLVNQIYQQIFNWRKDRFTITA